tara:strand:+ start:2961 stop:3719 length:759 start_codon:yes stop_codon:yes gene_type:complete
MKDCCHIFIDAGGAWRVLRSLGDSIIFLSKVLNKFPCKHLHLYQKNSIVDWHPRFLEILKYAKDGERVTLHKVGERPKGKADYTFSDHFNPYAEFDYLKMDMSKVPYNQNVIDKINFKKTICWSARYGMRIRGGGGKITDKKEWQRQFVNVPESVKEKYPDFNFINLGMPLPIQYDLHGKPELAGAEEYDLATSIWIIKKSYKYLGIDSGGTHLALTIKEPEDVLFYSKCYPQKNPVMVDLYTRVGLSFVED